MAERSFGFAIGNLRARENALLKKSDMTALSSLKDTDELARALADRAIGDRTARGDVEQALSHSNSELWKYIFEISPDNSVFMPFIIQNDFHNFKVVLKGIIKGVDYSSMLIRPENIEIETLQKAVCEKQFDLLGVFMKDAAAEAYDILTSSGDSQLCDGVLDAACMRAQLEMVNSKSFKSGYTADIIRATVFFNNIKSALRAARAHKSGAFLDKTLVETGFISASRIKSATLAGGEDILEILPLAGAIGVGAAAAFRTSPSQFERYCDNYIMSLAKKARFITMGIEPIIGYMIARQYELKNLRIIYSGIKTGQPQEIILGRLRELYG